MSVGFRVNFVNNTGEAVVLSAKVLSKGDWESDKRAIPDVDIHNVALAAFSAGAPIHLERHDSRASAPFVVTATFAGGRVLEFQLDGCDATDFNERASIPVSRGGDEFAAIQVLSHASEVGSGDWNRMSIFLTPQVDPMSWMANYPDRTLMQLNIPGTHDSGTYGGNGEMGTRCQTMSIAQQLEAGVRFFDLRLVLNPSADPNDLGVFHGDYFQHVWLRRDIMPNVVAFLARNPSECVVLCVKRESGLDKKPKGEPIDAVLHDILLDTVPKNKLSDGNGPVLDKTPIKNLKGCVVLLRRDKPRTFGFDVSKWADDQSHSTMTVGQLGEIELQDAYEYGSKRLPSLTCHDKWVNVKKQIDLAAAANANPDHWFINFTSASHSPPTAGYYPCDFATGGGWRVNHLLSRELVQHTAAGGVRVGTMMMDFPEEPQGNTAIRLLIALNG